MNTKIRKYFVLAMVAAMALSTAMVYAEDAAITPQKQGEVKSDAGCPPMDEAKMAEHAKKMEERSKKMAEELGLAPEQKMALDKDRAEFSAKLKDLREKIKAARTNLKAELDKPVADAAKANSLATEVKNLVGQQIQYRVDKVMAMKQILTPEQFSKMKSSMEKHKKEFKGKHENGK